MFDISFDRIKTWDGEMITIQQPALIVNVASKCALSGCQYDELMKLCKQYPSLHIYAFPSHWTGQEFETIGEVYDWLHKQYKPPINFHLMDFVNVNILSSNEIHPLFDFLLERTRKIIKIPIKWNFEKFLIDGVKIQRFSPTMLPTKIQVAVKNV